MISGIVIRGNGLGRKYGFPTANLDCAKKSVEEESGIYAAWVFFDQKKYMGALAIQDKPWGVEVHILDFRGDLYGKYIEVEPVQKVSEYKNYDSTDELINKIRDDVVMIQDVLSKQL